MYAFPLCISRKCWPVAFFHLLLSSTNLCPKVMTISGIHCTSIWTPHTLPIVTHTQKKAFEYGNLKWGCTSWPHQLTVLWRIPVCWLVSWHLVDWWRSCYHCRPHLWSRWPEVAISVLWSITCWHTQYRSLPFPSSKGHLCVNMSYQLHKDLANCNHAYNIIYTDEKYSIDFSLI